MTPLDTINSELRRLQRLTSLLLVFGAVLILGVVVFAVHEVRELRHHQTQLAELTDDLCETLERAGILIQGSTENPCER